MTEIIILSQNFVSANGDTCFIRDVDSSGNDIELKDPVSSAVACQALCRQNANCNFFVYGVTVQQNKCFLKSDKVTPLTTQTGLIFGQRACLGKFITFLTKTYNLALI